jgi:hypothetical protein
MARKADIILFQNFNKEQLQRLIQQLGHLRDYHQFIDYIYDGDAILDKDFKLKEHVSVDVESIYYSTIKKELEGVDLPDNKIVGKIIDPLFIKENYYLVEIQTPVQKHQLEIYYSNLSKINII